MRTRFTTGHLKDDNQLNEGERLMFEGTIAKELSQVANCERFQAGQTSVVYHQMSAHHIQKQILRSEIKRCWREAARSFYGVINRRDKKASPFIQSSIHFIHLKQPSMHREDSTEEGGELGFIAIWPPLLKPILKK
jgi:hypothetical protein